MPICGDEIALMSNGWCMHEIYNDNCLCNYVGIESDEHILVGDNDMIAITSWRVTSLN
jgi:hypothetical protein